LCASCQDGPDDVVILDLGQRALRDGPQPLDEAILKQEVCPQSKYGAVKPDASVGLSSGSESCAKIVSHGNVASAEQEVDATTTGRSNQLLTDSATIPDDDSVIEPARPTASMAWSVSQVVDLSDLRLDEPTKVRFALKELSYASDGPRVWICNALQRWQLLAAGDAAQGGAFFEAAEPMSTVYQWVFHNSYAINYLRKDLQGHVDTARQKWPDGAVTLQEAVRSELSSMGLAGIEKAYWNTCTVRILWMQRTLRMFVLILQDLCDTQKTPVEAAKNAVDAVMSPLLSRFLTAIAGYIINACVFRTREKLFQSMNVPETELLPYIGNLARTLRPHVDGIGEMLQREVPTVLLRKI